MKKKGGFILTAELILIATILVIGMIVGMVVVRDALVAEMEDVAESIGDINQSFSFGGVIAADQSSLPATSGASVQDAEDVLAGDVASPVLADTSITFPVAPAFETGFQL